MKSTKIILISTIIIALTAGLLALLYFLSFNHSSLVEQLYSRNIYPVLSAILAFTYGSLPFSFGEISLYFFIAAGISAVFLTIYLLIKRKGSRLKILANFFLCALMLACVVYTLFLTLWGFNYAREPLTVSLNLNTAPVHPQKLYSTCVYLINEANLLRQDLSSDNGIFVSAVPKQDILKIAPAEFESILHKTLDYPEIQLCRVKPVLASEGMCFLGISGIYFPFTGESNINYNLPDISFAPTALHEIAHQVGFAREDEASFLAYYVSEKSDTPEIRYTGTVYALIYAMNQLYSADIELYRTAMQGYTQELYSDVYSINDFWQQYEGKTADAVETINNNYLKANNQKDGVKSYGRMVDLLIAYLDV